MSSSSLTLDEVIARLAASGPPGRRTSPRSGEEGGRPAEANGLRPRGDHDLNPDFYDPSKSLTPAAVLVPIVDRDAGPTVLLTRRTDHLYHHAGQISFPGGQVDPVDSNAEAAALRETEEEIGLPRRHITLVGTLDTYVTRTGFEVLPKVGVVAPPFPLAPDSFEVAEVFEVPLDFFLVPENRKTHSRVYQGKERHFYVFPYRDYFIWGATAGMLVNLVEVLGDR